MASVRRANRHDGSATRAFQEREKRARSVALYEKQLAFVQSTARFGFFVGGIGSGKSVAGAVRAIVRSMAQPGSLGLIGAPTYPMLRDTTQRTFFELLPPAAIKSYNKTDQHLILRNGSEILFRSMDDPDRSRGLNLAWFWLDEAPLCGYYAWQILKGRLRQRGYDVCAWATGTPHGLDGYARDFETERREGHALYRASTRENPYLREDFVDDLGYTGQLAEQDVEGRFVAFDGLVYELDGSEGGHIRRASEGQTWRRVIGGVDWGHTNPTAALAVGLDGDRRAWVLEEYYKRRAGDEGRIPAIVDMARRLRVAVWYCDPEDPEAVEKLGKALAVAGLPSRAVAAKKGPGSVVAGIQTVTSQMALRSDGTRGLYVDPSCVATLGEFGAYQYATAPGEGTRVRRDPSELPLDQANHALDALRYALHGELGGMAATEAYLEELRRRRLVAAQQVSELVEEARKQP